MPPKKVDTESVRKSESEIVKWSETEIIRRQSTAGAQLAAGQFQSENDMTKFVEEIRGMFKDLKKDMSTKLKSIDDKFSNIITELREDIGGVREELAQSNAQIQNLQRQVDEVDKGINYHSDKVDDIERQQEEQYEELNRKIDNKIEELNKKVMMIEKHERKYNLIFHGIEEERLEKLYGKMRAFFVSAMDIDQERVEKIVFSNGHRMPTKATGIPKPVIMRFASFEARELVISRAFKLAGTGKKILSDLPTAMKEERARLAKEAFDIRQKEKLKTRIRDVGLDMVLEVRKSERDKWVARKNKNKK